jgi:hypothetical protein
VTALDVVEDISPGLGSGPVLLPVHPFPLKHAEEALGCGIVRTTPHRTHAADHLVGLQEPLVLLRGELTAPIRVQNDWGTGGRCRKAISTAWTTSWQS